MNETQLIKMSRLELNKGQIPGLPGNPRQWTQGDIDRLAQSLKDTPELFEARPIIAVPHDGKLVILGGNLRYCASKYNGAKEVPVFVLPEDTPADKLKEIVIKDNGTFGAWDFDLLANQWDDLPLATWGVPAWDGEEKVSPDEFGTDFQLPDGDKAPFRQVAFQLSNEMAEVLLFAVEAGKCTEAFYGIEGDDEDKNANGVAAYVIAKEWLDQKGFQFNDEDYNKAKAEMEDLRLYLRDALNKSGRKASDVDTHLGTNGMAGHYFGASQWMFPTKEAYDKMKEILPLSRDFYECKKVELRFRLINMLKNGQS